MKERRMHGNRPALRRLVMYPASVLVVLAWVALGSMPASGQAPLLQSTDLQYLGAFRVPSGSFGGKSGGFDYGGTAPAYNATNGSLFIVGHDWDQMVAEVKIPTIVNSANLNSLNSATVLQQFKDPSEGLMYTVANGASDPNTKVGGLLAYQGQLFGTAYLYYDGSGSQVLSHYRKTSFTLASAGTAHGMYQVGKVGAGFVSGYMAPVPSEWQAALGGLAITGNCCLSIIGRTSSGPAAFAFNPTDLGVTVPAPATALVYYPLSNPLAPGDTQNSLFNLSTKITGVVFPDGTRSVLFFGKIGTGPYCYGETTANGGSCNDPAISSKGTHMYPYVYQVWAYDVNDLIAVKNGQKQPWSVRPYATWNLNLPFADSAARVGGAAWDPQSRRVYISAQYSDGARPVIHAFQVAGTTRFTLPAPPTNLQAR